jgi:hypothetical protein
MKPLVVTEYILDNGTVDAHSMREDLFDYFNTLHYMLSDTEFDHISQYAKQWISEHLSDSETFERSIKAKAWEMNSGDHLLDYYNALILRRDQLLAARDVFREYTRFLRDIFSEERDNVMNSLKSFDFDSGIYLRAQEYQHAREKLLTEYNKELDKELTLIEKSIGKLDDKIASGDTLKKTRASKEKSDDGEKKSTRRYFKKATL